MFISSGSSGHGFGFPCMTRINGLVNAGGPENLGFEAHDTIQKATSADINRNSSLVGANNSGF